MYHRWTLGFSAPGAPRWRRSHPGAGGALPALRDAGRTTRRGEKRGPFHPGSGLPPVGAEAARPATGMSDGSSPPALVRRLLFRTGGRPHMKPATIPFPTENARPPDPPRPPQPSQRPRYEEGWRAGKPVEDPQKTKTWGWVTAKPSEYLVHVRRGQVLRSSGQGASCFKLPWDSVAIIPTTISRLQFVADQVTKEKV